MNREELTITLTELIGATPDEQAEISEKILAENDRINGEAEQAKADYQTAQDSYKELRKKYVQNMLNSGENDPEPENKNKQEPTGRTSFESLFTPVQ